MTAEELLELMRETNTWDYDKINRVFEGCGVYGYLNRYGVNSFVNRIKRGDILRIDDLKVGDVIRDNNLRRYAVLCFDEDGEGIYTLTDKREIRYFLNCDFCDWYKTGINVLMHINFIANVLNDTDEEDDCPFEC